MSVSTETASSPLDEQWRLLPRYCIKMSFGASVHALQTHGSMDGLLNNGLGAEANGYSIQYNHATTWALL